MIFQKNSFVWFMYTLLFLFCLNHFGSSQRSRKLTCHLALFPIKVSSSGCNSKMVKVQGCSGYCFSQSRQSSYLTWLMYDRNVTSYGRCCRIRDKIQKRIDFGGHCGSDVVLFQASSCECSHCAND